jgi:uncharacterized protein (DUF4415 family)
MRKRATTRRSSDNEAIDYSGIPKLDERFFANAVAVQPQTLMAALGSGAKEQITLRIDQDVIEFFKSQGKGYQRPDELCASCVYVASAERKGVERKTFQAQAA